MIKKLKDFKEAEKYLYTKIPSSYTKKFPGEVGLKGTKKLLKKLGNPQEKIKVIHIAGTSGKGSTALMISSLLKMSGFKVCLTLSPHIEDIRERVQIENKLISRKKFTKYLNEIIPLIEETNKQEKREITYFEVLQVLAYYAFAKERVDYGVVETGLGGTFDATNVVGREDKISVITKIGKDHVNILGNTIEEITNQKVGIIKKNNLVIYLQQGNVVNTVIKNRALKTNSKTVDVKIKKDLVNLGLEGEFQKENASIAIETYKEVLKREGKTFEKEKTDNTLSNIKFKGRFDIVRLNGNKVVIDGAHNEQKMRAFISSLKIKFPGEKFTFLMAFKKGKEIDKMIEIFIPLAEKIVVTEFFQSRKDVPKLSEDVKNIEKILKSLEFKNLILQKDPKKAFLLARKDNNILVVTGSLYLTSEIYQALKTQ